MPSRVKRLRQGGGHPVRPPVAFAASFSLLRVPWAHRNIFVPLPGHSIGVSPVGPNEFPVYRDLGSGGRVFGSPLISTGADRPFGLFAYVTLLNMGLLALVAVRGWGFLWGFAGPGRLS